MNSKNELSLQETWAPKSICYGCGPNNNRGLKIRSFDRGDFVVCDWQPLDFHQAFPGMLNGGIIGTLLDCHCNWTAAWRLKNQWGLEHLPCTVTAEYSIKLLKPTPANEQVHLESRVVEFVKQDRVWIEGTLTAGGVATATCRGLFVAVREGHPAFHRWA